MASFSSQPKQFLDAVSSNYDVSQSLVKLTKAEKLQHRIKENLEWKNISRATWSEKDPNPRHSLYYKQQIPFLLNEWLDFQTCLNKVLPLTFRLTEHCNPIIVKGDLLFQVPWLPHAWQFVSSSAALTQPTLQSQSDLLLRESRLGNIVRQELVSMIPSYMLDVQQHHVVLDMCAAPGSKTEQIVSLMKNDLAKKKIPNQQYPSGILIANDADPKRIGTLIDRLANNPSPFVIFTCARAEDFVKDILVNGSVMQHEDVHIQVPMFDRILADVPCSGDGTFRKCPHLWRLFRPRIALDFHLIQLKIALAGIQLLAGAGSRFVYSTCSLNPIEDEAVVAAVLAAHPHTLRLVDPLVNSILPRLKYRPGLLQWYCDEDILTIGEDDEATRRQSKSRLPRPLPKSAYAPRAEVAADMHLERCMRVVPHDQDTGGFFIAVFEKIEADVSTTCSDVLGATTSGSFHGGSTHIGTGSSSNAGGGGGGSAKHRSKSSASKLDPDIDEHHWYQAYTQGGGAGKTASGPSAAGWKSAAATAAARPSGVPGPVIEASATSSTATHRALDAMRSLGYNPQHKQQQEQQQQPQFEPSQLKEILQRIGGDINNEAGVSVAQLQRHVLCSLSPVDATISTKSLGLHPAQVVTDVNAVIHSNALDATTTTAQCYLMRMIPLPPAIKGDASKTTLGTKRPAVTAADIDYCNPAATAAASADKRQRKKGRTGEQSTMFGSRNNGWKVADNTAVEDDVDNGDDVQGDVAASNSTSHAASEASVLFGEKLVLLSIRATQWLYAMGFLSISSSGDGATDSFSTSSAFVSNRKGDVVVQRFVAVVCAGGVIANVVPVLAERNRQVSYRTVLHPFGIKIARPLLRKKRVIKLALNDFLSLSLMGCDHNETEEGDGQANLGRVVRTVDVDSSLSSSAIASLDTATRQAAAGSSNFIVAILCANSLNESISMVDNTSGSSFLGQPNSSGINCRRLSKAEKKKLKKQTSHEMTSDKTSSLSVKALEQQHNGDNRKNMLSADELEAVEKISGFEIVLQLVTVSPGGGRQNSDSSVAKQRNGDGTGGLRFFSSVECCESMHTNLLEFLKGLNN